MLSLRNEKPGDAAGIRQVHTSAFPTAAEAALVDALRGSGIDCISLVAELPLEGIVGHILFTPVELSENPEHRLIYGLAPMAVVPRHQGEGIGSTLVRRGLEQCRDAGIDALVVLGHPEFYPRFGFVPSVSAGIKTTYDVPDEVFMVRELVEGSLKRAYGVIKYAPQFESG